MNGIEKIFSLVFSIKGDKQLKEVRQQLGALLKTMAELSKLPGMEKLNQALGVLETTVKSAVKRSKEHANQTKRTATEQAAAAQYTKNLNAEFKNLSFTKKELATLSRNHQTLIASEKGSVDQLKAQVNILAVAWTKMGAAQRNSIGGKKITAELKNLRNELRQLTMGAGDTSRNVGNYMSGLYNAVSSKVSSIAAGVYAFKKVVQTIFGPFQDLEYRMAMVREVSGATAEEFVLLEQNARQLGATTEYTATEVAGLQLAYARMGFVPKQIIDITGATLDLATATGEDLAKSADVVGITLKGFGLTANQTQRVVDVMAKSFNSSSLQLESFNETIKYVAPIAKTANVSLEQTAAMMGVLADRGIRGSQAGTSLRRIFTEIARDGGSVSERLEELSKKGLTLGGAFDEVGRHAMTALTVLARSKKGVDDLTVSLYNSEGAAKRAADGIRDTMKGDVDKFLSAISEKLIALGESLAPLARSVVQAGTWMVTNFKEVAGVIAAAIVLIKGFTVATALYHTVVKLAYPSTIAFGRAILDQVGSARSATGAMRMLAAAKLFIAKALNIASVAVKGFGRALMANPYTWIIPIIGALVTLYFTLRDSTNSATKAQKRYNDEQETFKKAQEEKRKEIDSLIRTIRDETETMEAKIRAYKRLQELSTALTKAYTLEQLAVGDMEEATKKLNKEQEDEHYASLIKGARDASDAIKKLKEQKTSMVPGKNNSNTSSQSPTRTSTDAEIDRLKIPLDQYKRDLAKADRIRAEAAEKLKPIELRIKVAEDNAERLKRDIKIQRDRLLEQYGSEGAIPIIFRFVIKQKETALAKEEGKLADLDKERDTPPGGGGGQTDWSLSNDKQYNSQLMALKTQLLAGQIKSEDQYQKQVLQLEIDTLTKRIALNKDGAEAILKLKSDLIDKQIQQQKREQQEAERYDASRTKSSAQAEKEVAALRKAEIEGMEDSVQKKLMLEDHNTQQAKRSADAELDAALNALSKEQEAYKAGSKEHERIEGEKADLIARNMSRVVQIETDGQRTHTNILRSATLEQLRELAKIPAFMELANKAIAENLAQQIENAQKNTTKGLADAQSEYTVKESIADTTHGKSGRKRETAGRQNKVDLLESQANLYTEQLMAMAAAGDTTSAKYQEILAELTQVQEQAMNIGQGKNEDGSGGGLTGWLTRSFEISPEEANQVKQQAIELAQEIGNAVIDVQKQASQRKLNNEKKAIDAEYKIHTKLLDDKRDKGLISEKTYQREMEKLEAEKAKKEEEAERAAFEREKRLNIMQVIMNTAVGIAGLWPKPGFPAAIPMTALVGAMGVAQIATIAAQKYAQGGIIPVGDGMGVVKGRSHTQGGHQLYIDGRPIGEIEGDELIAIVNKRDTARIGALSAINSKHGRKFSDGGVVSPRSYRSTNIGAPLGFIQMEERYRTTAINQYEARQAQTDEQLAAVYAQVDATDRRIDRLKVIVVEREITDAQKLTKKIELRSRF